MSDATTIRQLADQYRRDRVVFDHLRQAFDANEDASHAEEKEASMLVAYDQSQNAAEAMRQKTPGSDDDRVERVAVLLDAGLMAGLPTAELVAHLQTLEIA